MNESPTKLWPALAVERAVEELKTDPAQGLSGDRAAARRHPFKSPLIYARLVAAMPTLFYTVPRTLAGWGLIAAVASSVLRADEPRKLWLRRPHRMEED